MTGFYAYDDSLEVEKITEDTVILKIRGAETYQSGEYTNERNATKRFEVCRETAESVAKEILSE